MSRVVFIIEDDQVMQSCLASIVRRALSDTGSDTSSATPASSSDPQSGRSSSALSDSSSDTVFCFGDAISAMSATLDHLPTLIFLDVLLDGPDGFTFLNELASYSDLGSIPVVLVTSLDLATKDLTTYGVVGILDKSTMTPQEISRYVARYA